MIESSTTPIISYFELKDASNLGNVGSGGDANDRSPILNRKMISKDVGQLIKAVVAPFSSQIEL